MKILITQHGIMLIISMFFFLFGSYIDDIKVISSSYLIAITAFSIVSYKCRKVEKEKEYHKNESRRLRNIYKELELGVRKDATRY